MRTSVRVKTRSSGAVHLPGLYASFGTFAHAYKLDARWAAFMPPHGLLCIAAYMPAECRPFHHENIRPSTRPTGLGGPPWFW